MSVVEKEFQAQFSGIKPYIFTSIDHLGKELGSHAYIQGLDDKKVRFDVQIENELSKVFIDFESNQILVEGGSNESVKRIQQLFQSVFDELAICTNVTHISTIEDTNREREALPDKSEFMVQFENQSPLAFEGITDFRETLQGCAYMSGAGLPQIFEVRAGDKTSGMTMYIDFDNSRMALNKSGEGVCTQALGVMIQAFGQFDLIIDK